MGDQVVVTKDIGAPATTVWALVSDLPRMGEWSPENCGGQWVKGSTGPTPGARFKGENANGDKSWSTDAKVVDSDPGRRFSFLVTVGPIKIAKWEYDFEETADGCRVTETWTDQRNWLAKVAGGKASGVSNRGEHNRLGMQATLDRIAVAATAAS